MGAGKQRRSGVVSVRAKAKNFHFKLRATNIFFPAWALSDGGSGGGGLSFLLRLRSFSLKLKTQSQPGPSPKSKFTRLFLKFRSRRRPTKTQKKPNPHFPETGKDPTSPLEQPFHEGLIWVWSGVTGCVALFAQLIARMKGVSTIFDSSSKILILCICLILKKYVAGKYGKLLLVSAAVLMACLIVVDWKNHLDNKQGRLSLSEWCGEAVSFVASASKVTNQPSFYHFSN